MRSRFLAFAIFVACVGPASAEIQFSLTEVLSVVGARYEANDLTDQKFVHAHYPEFVTHWIVLPVFDFSESFQSDSRIDAFVAVNALTGTPQLAVKEAFVDLLFWNALRLKGGYLKNDLGYNSRFHPLTVVEMSPDFGQKFPEIVVGNDSQGTTGMPAASVSLNWTTFDSSWKWTWDNVYYFLSATDARDNFILEKLSLSVDNWAFGVVYGFQPKAFDSTSTGYAPAAGAYCSYVTSFGLVMFWEGLYKRTSAKAFVDASGPLTLRTNGDFFNQSLRLEYGFVEPLAKNNVSLSAEYFYYGEGYTASGYENLVATVRANAVTQKRSNYFVPHRTFQHEFEFAASYSIAPQSLSLNYALEYQPYDSSTLHTFAVSKTFSSASLSAFVVGTPNVEDSKIAIRESRRFSYGLNLSLEL